MFAGVKASQCLHDCGFVPLVHAASVFEYHVDGRVGPEFLQCPCDGRDCEEEYRIRATEALQPPESASERELLAW